MRLLLSIIFFLLFIFLSVSLFNAGEMATFPQSFACYFASGWFFGNVINMGIGLLKK